MSEELNEATLLKALAEAKAAWTAREKLRDAAPDLLAAAKTYFERYCQDEAEDVEHCVCGQQQHEDAKALRAAISKADPSVQIERAA